MELQPLNASHDALLRVLQQQDDVWEFVGTLPQPQEGDRHRLLAIMEGQVPIGIGGLIRSQAFDGKDVEVLCALPPNRTVYVKYRDERSLTHA